MESFRQWRMREYHDRPKRENFIIWTERKLKKDCGQIKAGHWTEQETNCGC